ncbi:MAG TPA: hypothetical protein VFG76_05225, partial [Candidatus Polarisedimenticolia bacterium]|nr:hypothetical protein [Candidatus Polarisedimenticolia bacterium]
MRLVEGASLAELLRRDQRMDVPRAVRLLGSIASALGHAHRRGVVHRDVKPRQGPLLRAAWICSTGGIEPVEIVAGSKIEYPGPTIVGRRIFGSVED